MRISPNFVARANEPLGYSYIKASNTAWASAKYDRPYENLLQEALGCLLAYIQCEYRVVSITLYFKRLRLKINKYKNIENKINNCLGINDIYIIYTFCIILLSKTSYMCWKYDFLCLNLWIKLEAILQCFDNQRKLNVGQCGLLLRIGLNLYQ